MEQHNGSDELCERVPLGQHGAARGLCFFVHSETPRAPSECSASGLSSWLATAGSSMTLGVDAGPCGYAASEALWAEVCLERGKNGGGERAAGTMLCTVCDDVMHCGDDVMHCACVCVCVCVCV